MSSVDERIVNMKINNGQFLSGVKSSRSALTSLNDSVSKVAKGDKMSGLGNAVDGITHKFSLMRAAALGMAATVGVQLAQAGIKLVKSFTIDPIREGFHNYEAQINAAKVILANTAQAGVKMPQVTAALKDLNIYAQKTVYNMGDMAHAVGTFTAAGVGLTPAVKAIQGIANLGAMTGSTSAQVSSAFIQMSQAISAGQVRLQDWNSFVQEGVANTAFQKVLAESAVAMGDLGKNAVKLVGPMQKVMVNGENFRNSMQVKKGDTPWLTGKAFTLSLDIMSGKMTEAQLISKGFTEAQAHNMIKLGLTAKDAATKVKTITQLFTALKEEVGASWALLFRTVIGDLPHATKTLSALHTTLDNMQASVFLGIDRILTAWVEFGGRKAVIQGVVNIWHALGNVVKAVGKAWNEAFPDSQTGLGKTLADISKGFERLTRALIPGKAAMADITDIFKAVFQILGVGITVVKDVFKYFFSLFDLFITHGNKAGGGILGMVAGVARLISSFLTMTDLSGKIDAFFNHIIEARAKALTPIIKIIGEIIQAFDKLFHGNTAGFKAQLGKAFGDLGGTLQDAAKHVQDFFNNLQGGNTGIFSKVAGGLAAAAGKIKDFGGALSHAFDAFKGGASKGASGSASKMGDAASSMSNGFEHLVSVLKTVGGWMGSATSAVAHGLQGIWKSVTDWMGHIDKLDVANVLGTIFGGGLEVVLVRAISRFSKKMEGWTGMGEKISGSFGQLTNTLKTMQSSIKYKVIEEIAIAVGVLVASLFVLSKIPAKKLATGLGAVTLLIGELVGAMMLLTGGGGKGGEGEAKGGFSAAKIAVVAGALILMSTAIVELAGAVAAFGNMNLGTLVKGFAAIAVALGLLVGAAIGMSKVEPAILAAAAAMVILSFGLTTLLGAILLYDKIKWSTLLDGIFKIAVVMGVLQGGLAALSELSPLVLVSAIALGVLAGSLAVLLKTIVAWSKVSWGTMLKGVAEIAVAVVAIGTAALLAAPGVALLGIGMLALGAGLLMAGAGITLFAGGMAVLVGLGTAAFGVITVAIQTFLALLPTIAVQVAVAMVAWMGTMAKAAPKIGADFVKIISAMLTTVNKLMPKIVHTLSLFIDQMLKYVDKNAPKFGHTMTIMINTGLSVLRKAIPRMTNTGLDIVQAVLKGAASRVGGIAKQAVQLIANFLNGVASRIGHVVTAGTNVVIKFLQGVGKNSKRLADAGLETVVKVINGMTAAVNKHSTEIGTAGGRLAGSLVHGVITGLGAAARAAVSSAIGGIVSAGISKMHSLIKNPPYPSRVGIDIGKSLAIGFAVGIDTGSKVSTKSAGAMAQSSIDTVKDALQIQSPSKILHSLGLNFGTSFAKGITASLSAVVAAGAIMAGDAIDMVSRTTTDAAIKADALAAKAAALSAAANELRHKKASKAAHKRYVNEAKKLDKEAKRIQKNADAAQRGVDRQNKALDDATALAQADKQGKADIYNQRAQDSAAAAEADRKKAIQFSEEADLIRKKDAKRAKELDKAAKSALASAQKAANAAQSNAAKAASWAAQAVVDSIVGVQQQIDADKSAADLTAKLATMTAQEKADYYNQLQLTQQATSDAKYAAAQALLDKAMAESATNATQATADVAEANQDVQDAEAAKQAADQAASDAQSALEAAGQAADTAQNAVNQAALLMPDTAIASSHVFAAQNMFDAYAKALAATQSAASEDRTPTVQFVQNNTSPVALSPTEVYRQTNNLLSNAERKLTGASK